MKSAKKVSLLVVCAFVVSFSLCADSQISGMVLSTNWGNVYLGFTSNSFAIVYQTPTRYGMMEGQFKTSSQIFEGMWSEVDNFNSLTGNGKVELEFGDTSFRGIWYKNDGSFGGNWKGTVTRQFTADDIATWRSILGRFEVYP